MTRAFQIAYVDLDTPAAEQEIAYYDRVLGATPAESRWAARRFSSCSIFGPEMDHWDPAVTDGQRS